MAYIKDEEINAIRNQTDIVDVIADYIPVKPQGRNYVAVCPFHDDHSPSLVISKERQIFNCFTCRTGGNVFSFIMKYENVNFVEAVKTVATKIGYNLNIGEIKKVDKKNKDDYEIMDFISKYYKNNLFTENGVEARKYLNNRGITDEIIKEFNLGLSSKDKDNVYKLAMNKKWPMDKLDNLGLINKVGINIYDTFINRIMIPIENIEGEVVGFTGRIYGDDKNTAKYLNTKETEIFQKGHILFNYHNAKPHIRDAKELIIVEGNMDAISLSARGIKNVVALMGVALTKEQISIIKKLRVPVVLMLDNDSAGLDATIKNGELLLKEKINVKVVRLTDAKDPDEYIRQKGIDALKDNIKHSQKYIDFKIEYLKKDKDLNKYDDTVAYVRDVLNSLENEDELTKSLIMSKISKDYNIDIDILKKNLKLEKVENVQNEEKIKPVKISKYCNASHKVLYYMLMDNKYITIFKNRLGYLKEKRERILVSEIVYYNQKNNGINIADFTTYMMNNEEIYDFIQIIIGENSNTNINEEEFYSCIDAILKIYKKEEINDLKQKIKEEMDINKKLELMNKLTEIKKEV